MKPSPVTSLSPSSIPSTQRRILGRVRESPGGCWEWTGRLDHNGYGKYHFTVDGVSRCTGSHRAAWLAWRGPIESDQLQIDHLCRNRACCNPEHLALVTNRENALRSIAAAGPAGRGRRAPMSCMHGHAYTPENTLVRWYGGYPHRICRECERRRNAERRARERRA